MNNPHPDMADIWTPERIARMRQLAEETGCLFLPENRGGYFDAPCVHNPRTGREVIIFDGYDLWQGLDCRTNQSREAALDWLK